MSTLDLANLRVHNRARSISMSFGEPSRAHQNPQERPPPTPIEPILRWVREWLLRGRDRDRGTPRGATPPTPPGIRVTYHGGSTGLSLGRDMQSGETERVEIVVAQGLLDRGVS
jgi:hypothetical protein